MEEDITDLLNEIEGRLTLLESNLPSRNDRASVSLTAKIPFKALDYREALSWRFAELSRSAFEAFKNDKLGTAIILTRAAVETTSALWYLNRKIKTAIELDAVGDIDEYLMRLLMGSKTDPAMPDPINVLTFVKRVDKEANGFLKQYDELSEFAHPNWAGTLLLYSKPNPKKMWTDFGSNMRQVEDIKQVGITNLSVALLIFEHSYNQISDMMPKF